ncbi:MAG TPA: ACP S-malonyltransferase [Bacteroidota bacterium]|nr:ACP S-malonyltransferase [Bacteroidota bacterium]
MDKTAYIFPGQGSQYVGMGKDLCAAFSAARDLFDRADGILGVKLSSICFEGPEDVLKQTANTQPAIFVHSLAAARLKQGEPAAMTAGHSLGEYSALVHAGALTFEDGLRLVRLRGELMQRAGEERPGTMAAVVGLDPEAVEQCCRRASAEGIVQCANFNSPGQIVISGSVAGVRAAMAFAKETGAKLVKELVVSGAFHSPLMESARNGLREALGKTALHDAKIPVYANVTAGGVQKAEEIRTLLDRQLISPVRWEESVRAMISAGTGKFVELGPGKVLQGLVKRIDASVHVSGIDKTSDVQTVVTA